MGRRRGKAAAGRHGSPRCHKKGGRRLSRASLSPAATAVGAAAGAGRPAAGQQAAAGDDGHGDGAGGAARPGALAPGPPPTQAGGPRSGSALPLPPARV